MDKRTRGPAFADHLKKLRLTAPGDHQESTGRRRERRGGRHTRSLGRGGRGTHEFPRRALGAITSQNRPQKVRRNR